jgi:hypothetical protein
MARLGTTGCGFEQPLEAMFRALQPTKNPGFLRGDALLAIVIVGDEDDCSAVEGGAMFGDQNGTVTSPLGPRTSFRCHEFGVQCDADPNPRALGHRTGCVPRAASQYMKDVAPFVDYVRSLKATATQVVVTAIAGTITADRAVDVVPDPDDATRPAVAAGCTSSMGSAFPAFRLASFVDGFGASGARPTICDDNLTDPMIAIGAQIHDAIGNPCVDEVLADREPGTPGLQPQCVVNETIGTMTTQLPRCDEGAPPCWRFAADVEQCPSTPGNLALEIDRGGGSAPLGTVDELRCAVE